MAYGHIPRIWMKHQKHKSRSQRSKTIEREEDAEMQAIDKLFSEQEFGKLLNAMKQVMDEMVTPDLIPKHVLRGEIFTRLRRKLGAEFQSPVATELGLRRGLFNGQLKRVEHWSQWNAIEQLMEEFMNEREDTAEDILERMRRMLHTLRASVSQMENINVQGTKVTDDLEKFWASCGSQQTQEKETA